MKIGYLVSIHKLGFLFKIKACEKITTDICLIFRGLFFEHNAEIGQKDHLWMDTYLMARCLKR